MYKPPMAALVARILLFAAPLAPLLLAQPAQAARPPLPALCAAVLSAPKKALFQDLRRLSGGVLKAMPTRAYSAPEGRLEPAPTPTATVTATEAQMLLDLMAAYPPFHAHRTDGGCDARAAAMTWLMEQMGIESRKIYVIGPGSMASAITTNGDIEGWEHHVAPVVRLDDGGDGIDVVLDPALSLTPLTVPQWVGRFGRQRFNTRDGHFLEHLTYPLGRKPVTAVMDREETAPIPMRYYYISSRFGDHHTPEKYLYEDGWNPAMILGYEQQMTEVLDPALRIARERRETAARAAARR